MAATAAPSADTRPLGRRRSEQCDRAIVGAAIDALVDDGYAGMTVEGVASRAGVGKATIYRRFSSKAELVVEAMRTRLCVDEDLPDTGHVRADLLALYRSMFERVTGADGELMSVFLAERSRHPELAEEFERTFITPRRAHARRLVLAAVRRRELPAGTDVELLAEVGPAIIWHRVTMGLPFDGDLPERIAAQFLPATLRRGAAR